MQALERLGELMNLQAALLAQMKLQERGLSFSAAGQARANSPALSASVMNESA